MREAGLPVLVSNAQGEHMLILGSKGVVRAVYPETNRVDIETEDGSYLTQVLVQGPYFPEVHKDGAAPSHVTYLHIRGQADAFCWPETHRRLLGPEDALAGEGGEAPERRYFHLHGFIFRHGDVTVRVTRDDRFVVETEQGDYIILDAKRREIRLHAPSVFVGTTTDAGRIEYEQDDSIRAYAPLVLVGTEVADRIEYQQGTHILLQAPIIKLTATEQIILDPPQIKFGNANATEHVLLGDSWMALFNAFVTLFNSHTHSNVQPGPSTSGPPTTPTVPMTTAQLSDIAFVSKTGL